MTVGTTMVAPMVDLVSQPDSSFPGLQVHRFAQVTGDVRLKESVAIALGAVVRAEAGSSCAIGEGSVLQEGAAVYGQSQGKVLGDDHHPYTVWLGNRVTLTHKVLVQGPAYLGSGSFVGFRSTIFNARLGAGCVVMMHALIQDVEIPPGKLVPSGAIITRQDQADGLADVNSSDLALVREMLGHGHLPPSLSSPQPQAVESSPAFHKPNGLGPMKLQQLSSDIVQRVRQYLAQGLLIGTEHADARRYRSGVWQTCSPITASREGEALQALETCLAEHSGEYVRIFGIDPRAKQRVAPVTIQRPDGKPIEVNGNLAVAATPATAHRPGPMGGSRGTLSAEVVQQVRQYLSQGLRIGTEHADARRYRSGVWQTCSPITASREGEVLAALEACLTEHSGEYVRLFGIDPRLHQRVAPITIQRPDGQPVPSNSGTAGVNAVPSPSSYAGSVPTDLAQQVRQLINQGYRIGAEHADQRRYRSGVWQTCTSITSTREAEVMAALTNCLANHPGEYVRVFGIDPVAKRRGPEIVIQRPGESASQPSAASPGFTAAPASGGGSNGSNSGQPLSQDLVQQINQLMNQGYRLSLEHADQRRYHSGAWQTGSPLDGSRISDILAALETQLRAYRGEYVRLIGVDPRVKRRVLEATIQRP